MTRDEVERLAAMLSDLSALDNTEFTISVYRSALMQRDRCCSDETLEDMRRRLNIALITATKDVRQILVDDLRTAGAQVE